MFQQIIEKLVRSNSKEKFFFARFLFNFYCFLLLAVAYHGGIKIYDIKTPENENVPLDILEMVTDDGKYNNTCVLFSKLCQNTIYSSTDRNMVCQWKIDYGSKKYEREKYVTVPNPVTNIAISKTHSNMAIAAKCLYIWHINKAPNTVETLVPDPDLSFVAVDYSKNGELLAALTYGSSKPSLIYIFHVPSGYIRLELIATGFAHGSRVKFSNDSEILAVCGSEGQIKTYNTKTFMLSHSIVVRERRDSKAPEEHKFCHDMTFSYDDKFLYITHKGAHKYNFKLRLFDEVFSKKAKFERYDMTAIAVHQTEISDPN